MLLDKLTIFKYIQTRGSPGGSHDKRICLQYRRQDPGLIPGSGRFPGETMATYSCILGWGILWTDEPGRLQSTGSKESDTTE